MSAVDFRHSCSAGVRYLRGIYWRCYIAAFSSRIGDSQKRLNVYRAASAVLPESVEVLVGLADALEKNCAFDAALDAFRRALTAAANPPVEAFDGALRVAVKLGRPTDALAFSLPGPDATPCTWLWRGRAYHYLGNTDEAIAAYRRVPPSAQEWLETQVEYIACLRLQGDLPAVREAMLEIETDWPEAAWSLFCQANHCAIAGRLDEATFILQECLRRAPDIAVAWALRGQLALENGEQEAAESFFLEATRREPGQAESLAGLAQIALYKADWNAYFSWQGRYVKSRPRNIATRIELVEALIRRWRIPEAVSTCNSLLNEHSDDFAAQKCAVLTYAKARKFRRAHQIADRLLLQQPNVPDSACLKAHVLMAEERFTEALEYAMPYDVPLTLLLAGQCLDKLGRDAEAEQCYRRTIEIDPQNDAALKGLGNLLQLRGQLDAAKEIFVRAIEMAPQKPEHKTNLGFLYWKQNALTEAEPLLLEALALDPDYLAAHLNLCIVLLTQGKFAAGWLEYEWRFRHQQHCDYPLEPCPGVASVRRPSELLPFDFNGKRILISREQGLGDELFFLRFAAKLKQMGAWLAYKADVRVASLVVRTGLIDRFVELNEVVENIHLVLLVGELPLMTGMASITDIPPPLRIDPLPEYLAGARERVRGAFGKKKPLLGLTWRAGPDQDDDLMRKHVPLTAFIDAVRGIDANFVILQRKPEESEIETLRTELGPEVLDCSSYNEDLEQMMGLVALLDDYVTVSNTNLHLRVSLGLPARVLIPCPPEYRWLSSGGGVRGTRTFVCIGRIPAGTGPWRWSNCRPTFQMRGLWFVNFSSLS